MYNRIYFVYVLASVSRRLYVGITNDIERRLFEHRNPDKATFCSKYRITRLVHYEEFGDVLEAIAREKQLKRWSRRKKIALIERTNAAWIDLSEKW